MSQNERLMIAAPLKPVAVGQSFDTLPPHVTVLPWYDFDTEKWGEFDADLREGLEEQRLSSLVSLGQESFGFNQEIEVTLVGGVMFGVHALVHELVRSRGGRFDETYMGVQWRPHISGLDIPVGDTIHVASLAVFRKDREHRKQVRAVYETAA